MGLRASAARQGEDIHAGPCDVLFPLTPALSLGERVNPALRGEQSRFLGFPLRDAHCSLPMDLAPTHPPVTPPRRGTGQPVLLPSWEGLGVGSAAQCANKIRGILSLRERVRVRVNGANEALAYRTFPGSVEPVEFPFWSFFRHSSFVIRHFVYSRHETFQPGHSPGTRIRSSAALRPAQACEVSRCAAQIPALGTGGLRADAAWHGVV